MKTIALKLRKSEEEVKAYYLASIDLLMSQGLSQEDARRITQEAFKSTLKQLGILKG